MHSRLRRFTSASLILAACATFASTLGAQVVFNFAGNIAENGSPIQITLAVSSSFAVTEQPLVSVQEDNGTVFSTQYVWGQLPDSGVTADLLISITSPLLTGSFVPGTDRVAAVGFINDATTGQSTFVFVGWDQTEGGFGPTFEGGAPLRFFYGMISGVPTFTAPPAGISVGDYFAAYSGSYTITNPSEPNMMLSDAPFGSASAGALFVVTSIGINAAAVPEPSTYAAIAGACALGLAAWRRRSRRA